MRCAPVVGRQPNFWQESVSGQAGKTQPATQITQQRQSRPVAGRAESSQPSKQPAPGHAATSASSSPFPLGATAAEPARRRGLLKLPRRAEAVPHLPYTLAALSAGRPVREATASHGHQTQAAGAVYAGGGTVWFSAGQLGPRCDGSSIASAVSRQCHASQPAKSVASEWPRCRTRWNAPTSTWRSSPPAPAGCLGAPAPNPASNPACACACACAAGAATTAASDAASTTAAVEEASSAEGGVRRRWALSPGQQ
eukprot:COSAG01_NODE_19888_length_983_cov_2.411765_2_plen_253_part_01